MYQEKAVIFTAIGCRRLKQARGLSAMKAYARQANQNAAGYPLIALWHAGYLLQAETTGPATETLSALPLIPPASDQCTTAASASFQGNYT